MGWCNHEGSQLFTGDFNGDGRADMLCHDKTGYKWVALASSAGEFTGTSWKRAMGWCSHAGSELHVGDFNGDGRTDMMCHDKSGYKWVALAKPDGSFTGTSWKKDMKWCINEDHLMIGDFNGDGRDDMLCFSNNHKLVSFANKDGSFSGTSWYNGTSWCTETVLSTYIADFNADGRDDILCHHLSANWLMLAQAGGKFKDFNGLPDWWFSEGGCAADQDFHVGDMNGDNRADIVCNTKSDGTTTISFANANSKFLS
jgi:hypothetical protein